MGKTGHTEETKYWIEQRSRVLWIVIAILLFFGFLGSNAYLYTLGLVCLLLNCRLVKSTWRK